MVYSVCLIGIPGFGEAVSADSADTEVIIEELVSSNDEIVDVQIINNRTVDQLKIEFKDGTIIHSKHFKQSDRVLVKIDSEIVIDGHLSDLFGKQSDTIRTRSVSPFPELDEGIGGGGGLGGTLQAENGMPGMMYRDYGWYAYIEANNNDIRRVGHIENIRTSGHSNAYFSHFVNRVDSWQSTMDMAQWYLPTYAAVYIAALVFSGGSLANIVAYLEITNALFGWPPTPGSIAQSLISDRNQAFGYTNDFVPMFGWHEFPNNVTP